ncbi:MAG: GNAT family N-acetyltransferase, partial [Desulfobacteraceae bacterium]|nr:GNAT family N-acetyltransferase [Desulfobacteraceae bacterium]
MEKIVSPETVLSHLRPGMSIFIGTGAAEPRTLVKYLMKSKAGNLEDLELIQLVSFGEAISPQTLRFQKFRLKTFFAGWAADEAIKTGRIDLIPSRFAWIPKLIESENIRINAAFIQVTPPDDSGNCSLGIAVDAARQAMAKASLVVGEINPLIPRTFGDTFVPVSDFDLMIHSEDPPFYIDRWPIDDIYDTVAGHVAGLIDDGHCIAFSIGPLFEALTPHLVQKRHLGIHSPFFTDALMDLVKSGAVSNSRKETYRGQSLVSYALGTKALMQWLDQNPMVEFQGIDKVFDPAQIGRNPKFNAIIPARKIDLSGKIALQTGKGNIATGPAEVLDFFRGAEISEGGRIIFALPSRNLGGQPNIRISVEDLENQFSQRESVDVVVTEYGAVFLRGYTIRERAQALIDLAHPDDRSLLVEQAKASHILYPDQIYFTQSGRLYPSEISVDQIFKSDIKIKFRPTKPSDEEEMRRLFYRFSDESVYARYLGHIQAMPHAKTQEYVNIDWSQVMSIVGVVKRAGKDRIIAEARYIREPVRPFAEIVFLVDEEFQGIGIASYLYGLLARQAKENGLKGFTAEVLFSNTAMVKVLKKGGFPIKSQLEDGVYHLEISLEGGVPETNLAPKPEGRDHVPLKDNMPTRKA